MFNQPLITIVLTTYNRAHLIGETLDSIIAQTYTNWECIIIDDNSDDNTNEFIKKYTQKDARFQFFEKKNKYVKGLSASRNMGMDLITDTDFIQFFDDDDIMHPQKFELQLKEFEKYDKLDFSFFNRTLYDEFLSNELRYGKYNEINSSLVNDMGEGYYFKKYFFTAQAPLFRCSYLSNLRFNEELFFAEEWELFLKLFYTKNTIASLITEPLYFHRNHSNSITTNLYGENQSIKAVSKYKAYIFVLDYIYKSNCTLPKKILINILFITLENIQNDKISHQKVKNVLKQGKSKFHNKLLDFMCLLVVKFRFKIVRKIIFKILIFIC